MAVCCCYDAPPFVCWWPDCWKPGYFQHVSPSTLSRWSPNCGARQAQKNDLIIQTRAQQKPKRTRRTTVQYEGDAFQFHLHFGTC